MDEAFLMIDHSLPANDRDRWAHPNRLGSTIVISDSTGAVIDTHTYSPFGQAGEGDGGFPFRFTGQKLDPETGLYYYKARYYDPELGRFLQTDPIGYADQMNLYAYVGNDPINATDPTGMCRIAEYGREVGICGDDAAAIDIVEGQLDDPTSIASTVEQVAVDQGERVSVVTDANELAGNSAAYPIDPDSTAARDAQVIIGLIPDQVPGNGPENLIDLPPVDAFEHELSHVLDDLTGAPISGPGIIDVSGAPVNVSRNGRNEGRSEARAINRTNQYRARTGGRDRRTEY